MLLETVLKSLFGWQRFFKLLRKLIDFGLLDQMMQVFVRSSTHTQDTCIRRHGFKLQWAIVSL